MERARLRQPLKDAADPDLGDRQAIVETRSRNGRTTGIALVDARGRAVTQTELPSKRRRSLRELALAKDPRYRRREAARKRALRAAALLRWLFVVPAGPTLEVLARTQGEARAGAKAALGIPRSKRLPAGTFADFLVTTAGPCLPTSA